MADKSKTIKEATDKELDAIILRLENERRAQNIIMELIRNSIPVSGDPYVDSYKPIIVSTESPIDSMYHVGIRGMRWGVRSARRSASKISKAASKNKPEHSEDSKTIRTNLKKPVKTLSTAELKDITKRMQLEKQVKDLKPNDIKKGMAVVKTILAIGATVNSLHAFSQTPAGQVVVKRLDIKKLVKTAAAATP